ncbi:MAG: hypothetical protein ACW967_08925 [Candidatus Hodarchaeales archaeon]
MTEIKPNSGLVAFFDILGYAQMLLSNEVKITAKLIVDVLSQVPKDVVAGIVEDQGLEVIEGLKSKEYFNKFWRKLIHEEIGWLLFSDSILISLPLDTEEDMFFWGMRVVAFLYVCSFLQRQMFDKGLPLRGAISYGDFYIQGSYFAGQPIIDAYQNSESLELSGCILTKSAEYLYNQMKQYAKENDFEESVNSFLDQICVSYLVPKKRDKLEKGIMVNWLNLPMKFFDNLPSDIRNYIFSSFVAYNKDATPIVYPKINNTESFVIKVLENVESKPWPAMSRRMDKELQNILQKRGINF